MYALGANLFAIRFDVKKLQVIGGPIPVVEDVMRSRPGNTAATFFSVSNNGSLAAVSGTSSPGGVGLAFVDKNGAKKPFAVAPSGFASPRISPDGKQVAVQVNDGAELYISVSDIAGKSAMRRLTFGGDNYAPLWTRDGQRIIFTSNRDGDVALFWQRADGSGSAERLTKAEKGVIHIPESASPDGKFVTLQAGNGVWILSLEGDRKMKSLIEVSSPASANRSAFSPDGHWLVYQSGVTGRGEIYVQPFPPTGAKYQISGPGGLWPLWSPDGKQIFYVAVGRGSPFVIVAVDIQTKPSFGIVKSTLLPIEGLIQNGTSRNYDITPDGKEIIATFLPEQTQSGDRGLQINVVLNWFTELQQRVPVK